MLRSDEPTVIPYIYAETETAIAEPAAEQPAAPSLGDAYAAHHSGAEETKSERKARTLTQDNERNATLADEENTARGIGESARKPLRREQTLSEAFDGVQPEEVSSGDFPEALQGFDRDAVEAAMISFGLTEADLEDERWVAAIADALENAAEADPDADPDAEEEDGDGSEETEEEKPAEKKPEEKKPADLPVPKSVEEFVAGDPEKLKALNAHTEALYNRSQETNSPVMVDLVTQAVARAIGTPPEQMEVLRNTMDIVTTGVYGVVETAVPKLLPALINDYMRQNFGLALEAVAPGLQESHITRTCEGIWGDVCGSDEFKDAELPKFGTPEFAEAAKAVHEKNPWLNEFDPKGPDGKQLPVLKALRVKAELTARLLRGERVDSKKTMQLIADAIATTKKSASNANRRASASRISGAGKTTGTIEKKAEYYGLMQAWQAGSGGGAI